MKSGGLLYVIFEYVFLFTSNSAALWFYIPYKFLSNKKFFEQRSSRAEQPRILSCQIFHLLQCRNSRQAKNINDMAKVNIKFEKITPFRGILHVRELFSRQVGPIIDKVLGLRGTLFDYYGGILFNYYLQVHKLCVLLHKFAYQCVFAWYT